MNVQMQRRAVLNVSGEFLVEMCKHGSARHLTVMANALPEDARIVGYDVDHVGGVRLILESETFPETPPAARLPELEPPMFQVVYEDDGGA